MTPLASTRPARILLVEDNEADVRLTREALREAGDGVRLTAVGDGEQALAYLRRQEGFSEAPRPDLVLLDLNLPRKNGREVLREIKADHRLSLIPVVVLSTSASPSDVAACYELHANAYVTKPRDFDEFAGTVARIGEFWGGVAARPRLAAHLT